MSLLIGGRQLWLLLTEEKGAVVVGDNPEVEFHRNNVQEPSHQIKAVK